MRKHRLLWPALVFGILKSALGSPEAEYRDDALASRLRVEQTFHSAQDETLRTIALAVYGHRTWWKRVQQQNPNLSDLASEDRVPANTRVKFLAPEIGSEYTVQKHDNLFRIAVWKFGTGAKWTVVYRNNPERIKDPRRIYPGDRLRIDSSGSTIEVTERTARPERREAGVQRQQVNEPVETPVAINEAPPAVAPVGTPFQDLMAPAPPSVAQYPTEYDREPTSGTPSPWALYLTGGDPFLMAWMGVLIVVFCAAFAWLKMSRERQAKFAADHVLEHAREHIDFDKSLMSKEHGDIERIPSYHSLLKKRWKEYTRFFKKIKRVKRRK